MNNATPAVCSIADKPFDGRIHQVGPPLRRVFAAIQSLRARLVGVLTLNIPTKGYRILTGQPREPLMGLVVNSSRTTLMLVAAGTMAVGGANSLSFFTETMGSGIDGLGARQVEKTEKMIEKNPVYVVCPIFKVTEPMFWSWLKYGLGTSFSTAVPNFMVSIVQLTLKVAAAMWAAMVINGITGANAEGFTNQALQQGGVGLLMTVLLVSAPAMAASFFGGTLGQFMSYSGVNGGGGANRPGPQGQPPGAFNSGARGGDGGAPASSTRAGVSELPGSFERPTRSSATTPAADVIKPPPRTSSGASSGALA